MKDLFEDASYQIIDCDVQNIVAHSEIPLPAGHILDIQKMYESMPMECTYQRNMFPGLIYRSRDIPVVLLCFYSGKVVLTGGKSLSDIRVGWKKLWGVVQRFIGSK
jgi:transcription initiation factor TFIID TATA-box-binding protein